MGADLFGSYVATVLAAMVLGIMLSKIWKYSRCFGGIDLFYYQWQLRF
jgi:Na+/H+-translocating membrane pyrophosphatase